MAALTAGVYTQTDLEQVADSVKIAIVKAMVTEKILTLEQAEEWCQNHTVLFREKTLFRTISNLWKKEVSQDYYLIVVKSVDPPEIPEGFEKIIRSSNV